MEGVGARAATRAPTGTGRGWTVRSQCHGSGSARPVLVRLHPRMDTNVPLYALTCGWCSTRVVLCRRHFHGQRYCGEPCRRRGAAASHRLASARYQRSLGAEGRQDRREQWRERRAPKEAKSQALPDVSPQKVAEVAECPLPVRERMDNAAVEGSADGIFQTCLVDNDLGAEGRAPRCRVCGRSSAQLVRWTYRRWRSRGAR